MNIIGISGLHNSVPFKQRELPDLPSRCYRIAQGFDAAAALITDDGVVAAAAEERFTGKKATGSFPAHAIQYCLQAAELSPASIDYIAHSFAYEPYRDLYEGTEYSKREFTEVYSRGAQLHCLQEHFPSYGWSDRFVQVPHHLAHAASTFYVSGLREALILVVDGMGEAHSATIAVGAEDRIEIIKQIPLLHSLGILYSVFTLYLGFQLTSDEYKVMGLAPYGNASRYFSRLMDLVQLKEDGTYTIPLLCKNVTVEEQQTYKVTLQILAELFGPPREPGTEITQAHKDIAAALQGVLQTCLMHVLRYFKHVTGQRNLCMAGGVALNCTANGMIRRSRLFKNFFIQPAAGDDGSALGAAFYVQHQHRPHLRPGKMGLPLWGPRFTDKAVEGALQRQPELNSERYSSFEDLASDVASWLAEGQIVAWFQGRMEFGPRALGNRSILADPRDPDMRDRLNQLIKKRENFRPFAPAVTTESAATFFEVERGDEALYAYMLLVAQVRETFRKQLPAVTHVDGSARLQTVSRDENPRFWMLLKAFEKQTGLPVLLNTSFNLREQPIVCSPAEAISTFLATQMDVLVIENYVITQKRAASGTGLARVSDAQKERVF